MKINKNNLVFFETSSYCSPEPELFLKEGARAIHFPENHSSEFFCNFFDKQIFFKMSSLSMDIIKLRCVYMLKLI